MYAVWILIRAGVISFFGKMCINHPFDTHNAENVIHKFGSRFSLGYNIKNALLSPRKSSGIEYNYFGRGGNNSSRFQYDTHVKIYRIYFSNDNHNYRVDLEYKIQYRLNI